MIPETGKSKIRVLVDLVSGESMLSFFLSFLLFICFFLNSVGMEHRASCMLVKGSTPELQPQPFSLFYFETGFH